MATLYDSDGKEYNIPHAIDIKEWERQGYTTEKPEVKPKRKPRSKQKEEPTETS